MNGSGYTREEEERLVRVLREGGPPLCPRCGAGLATRDVPPSEAISYVRDRLWLVCPRCRTSLVLDRRRVESGA